MKIKRRLEKILCLVVEGDFLEGYSTVCSKKWGGLRRDFPAEKFKENAIFFENFDFK